MLKTIAAFLNTAGGDLLIGVDDRGKVTGMRTTALTMMMSSCVIWRKS